MLSGGKTVLIGLDGAPYGLVKDLTDNGVMPNLGEILSEGSFCKINSSLPEISSTAWATIITGSNPGEHGLYGFTDLAAGTYTTIFPNFTQIKKAPFWMEEDFSCRTDKRYSILNVPVTYPAREVNGIHISGFVALDLDKAIYPPDLYEELSANDYRIDVDAYKAHESMTNFLRDLDLTLDKRIQMAWSIWEKEDWDVFMMVFTGTDRLSHFLWNAYEDNGHEHHDAFLDHFRRIDEYIGSLYGRLSDGDTIAFVSDHGFELLEQEVFINRYLYEWGYLKLKQFPAKSYNDIDSDTSAFCMDPGRIYVNIEGEYPRGSVAADEVESLCAEISDRFMELEIDGKKVVSEVFRKEDIFAGPCADKAPHLVLIGGEGFDLKGSIKSEVFAAKNIFNGKHTYDNAFWGKRVLGDVDGSENGISCIQEVRGALGL
ncbi:hypothetical protein BVX97_00905 [bacterium E08(2017)]|nr:hypothetical protein BVX97_00905 [bacterium E08(2017)]